MFCFSLSFINMSKVWSLYFIKDHLLLIIFYRNKNHIKYFHKDSPNETIYFGALKVCLETSSLQRTFYSMEWCNCFYFLCFGMCESPLSWYQATIQTRISCWNWKYILIFYDYFYSLSGIVSMETIEQQNSTTIN